MSSNKRIRTDNEEKTSIDDTTELTLQQIAKINQLISDTLLHDTYCPLIFKWLDMKFVLSKAVHISKYHHNLVFKHPNSLNLCRKIASNDFGSFVQKLPCKTPQRLIWALYQHFSKKMYSKRTPSRTNHERLHSYVNVNSWRTIDYLKTLHIHHPPTFPLACTL